MYGKVTRYFHDRSDYNAKNIMVIEAPERNGRHGKARKKHERVSESITADTVKND